MVIHTLISHPERLNRQTLLDLRKITAEHPYYQPARIALLTNLFLLHDPTFDDELRRAAIFLTDRNVLFQLVEASHYGIKSKQNNEEELHEEIDSPRRAASLIDKFLNNIPVDDTISSSSKKPTEADARNDYMSYLLSIDTNVKESKDPTLDIIDDFLTNAGGKLTLKEKTEFVPEVEMANDSEESPIEDNEVVTENMANIYIKQGNYDKALTVMKAINKKTKKKNPYFEDQERFLKKLIISQQK